ncbi:G5 and 3D domain-containing protein [Savagea serpentis]|nr:G5 and 3D domain-containing protein [Savagea serpentis]
MSNQAIKGGHNQGNKKSTMIFGTVIAILFVAIMALVLIEGTKKTIALTVEGEEMEVRTHAKTVEQLLEEQNIEVAAHDIVEPALDTPLKTGLAVEWIEAEEVVLTVDEEEQTFVTTKRTVGEVLEEAGIEVTEHDIVYPALEEEIQPRIAVTKAIEVEVVDGGESKKVWTTPTSVELFLANQQIALGEHDELAGVTLEDRLSKDASKVEVVRIEKVKEQVEAPTEFTVEEKKDANLEQGKTKVLQEGQKGKMLRTYEVVMRNGEEVERNVVEEEVVDAPKNKIVAVGSKQIAQAKPVNKTVVSRGNSNASAPASAPAGGKEFYVEATAYTPYCTGCSGISAAGINLRANPNLRLIAVDPRVIPMGSKVWVEGYGYAVAGDTGGAIKGNRIDVLMQTKSQAYSWGRKKVKIKVMN